MTPQILPSNKMIHLTMPENTSDLVWFLSQEIIRQGVKETEFVVAGGFDDETEVQSTNPLTNLTTLKRAHEEADTVPVRW